MQGAQRCRSTTLRVIQVILCDPNGQKVARRSSRYHTRIFPFPCHALRCTAVAAHCRPAVINLCQLRCRQPFGRGFCCRCAVALVSFYDFCMSLCCCNRSGTTQRMRTVHSCITHTPRARQFLYLFRLKLSFSACPLIEK